MLAVAAVSACMCVSGGAGCQTEGRGINQEMVGKLKWGGRGWAGLAQHHWTVKDFLSLFIPPSLLSAFCHLLPRQRRHRLRGKEKKKEGKVQAASLQSIKDQRGWESEAVQWGWGLGGGFTGEAGACGERKIPPHPSPLSHCYHPPRCHAARGEAASIPSRPASHVPYGAAAPTGALARPSSADKLQRPASFFTAGVSNAEPSVTRCPLWCSPHR